MRDENIKVAVIGRPNVGKSTLFNRLIKQRKSIVDDIPGVTRDRLYADVEWNGRNITLIDTGGLIYESESTNDEIVKNVKKQVLSAFDEANFIIFLVDGRSGVTSQDEKIASWLRKFKNKKEIFLAVNKIDTEKQLDLIHEFYSLGLGEPYPISALIGSSGLADILDKIASTSSSNGKVHNKDLINVSIVGKPNVGKSSILNYLVGEERSIVTSIPGTTRDSIDTKVSAHGKNYLLIDTAGLRRKSKISSKLERYAVTRAVSSIEQSDVVLLVIDATSDVSDQDQKIAALIKRYDKASLILVNKWDLVKNKKSNTMSKMQQDIMTKLHFVDYSKILFTSVVERSGFNKLWDFIDEVFKSYSQRITTSKLNNALEEIVLNSSLPSKKGKQLRIYYLTQAKTKPPEIVFFVNDSKIATSQFQRYLEKQIRDKFDFSGSPIKLVFRSKRKD